jgi:hypothetical protein
MGVWYPIGCRGLEAAMNGVRQITYALGVAPVLVGEWGLSAQIVAASLAARLALPVVLAGVRFVLR